LAGKNVDIVQETFSEILTRIQAEVPETTTVPDTPLYKSNDNESSTLIQSVQSLSSEGIFPDADVLRS
jgi:hypothetical protein